MNWVDRHVASVHIIVPLVNVMDLIITIIVVLFLHLRGIPCLYMCHIHDSSYVIFVVVDFKRAFKPTSNQLFQFNGELFEQTDGVAMGSPLGPRLANVFMCYI